jgi:DNA mismatch endonuclease (patch repair protein)
MMATIKGANTRPEIALRKALHALGLRFRLHDRKLPGRPDIVLPRWNAAIFVHGCFWHRHEGCRYATQPATRPDFWNEKFAANVARDQRNLESLTAAGWRTQVVWECDLKRYGAAAVADNLLFWLRSVDHSRAEESGSSLSKRQS